MKKQTTILLSILTAVLLLVAVGQFLLRQPQNSSTLSPQEPRSAAKVTVAYKSTIPTAEPTQALIIVSIDFSEGQKLSGQVSAKNAYEALTILAKAKNVPVEVKQYKYGLMVTKIGQKESSSSSYWIYSVNGKPAQIAADRYLVNPGDKVEWVYKK